MRPGISLVVGTADFDMAAALTVIFGSTLARLRRSTPAGFPARGPRSSRPPAPRIAGRYAGATSGDPHYQRKPSSDCRDDVPMLGAGCDVEVYTRWVVGVTGDFEFSDIKGQYSFNCPSPGCGPSGIGTIKEPWAWGVGGRVGYLVGPSLLTYWTGGFTQARFDQVNYSDAQTGATTGLVLPAQTYDGWYLGGGIEFAVGGFFPGLYWRTEYRFSDYQSRNVSQLCGGGLCGLPGTLHSIDRIRPQEQSIWTALVYRFNWFGLKTNKVSQ
jgi:opacity protein-like surface antigen